mmetsp:Transcript_10458/g.22439  ORF Transcript_10458/g.22439 Transcript_10458/m.22439 type:complete len:1189 (-) Transcript_10458:119-3685(-)
MSESSRDMRDGRSRAPSIRDRSSYTAGQALVTIVNDPRADANKAGWWGFWAQDTSWKEAPPQLDTSRYPNITRADLEFYLRIVGNGRYRQFQQDRISLEEGRQQQLIMEGQASAATQGDGLALALQQVPAQYFQEDFSLLRPGVLTALCECDDDGELITRIDQLSGYLDVVETQLMREIAARSKNVFEAAGALHDLHKSLCGTLDHIRVLRGHMSEVDEATYSAALSIAQLQRRRKNLVDSVNLLKGVEEVVASKSALQCLLEGQDYAGALELLENLRHSVDGQLQLGLQAFRHTTPQVEETIEVVQSLLSCEFVSLAHMQDMNSVIERAMNDAAAAAHEFERGGTEEGVAPGEGALRPPADSSLASSSSLGPLLAEMSASQEQLHDKLLPVVVGLFRSNKLSGVMSQMRENLSNEVKALIREVLERMLGPLLLAAGMEPPPLPSTLEAQGPAGYDLHVAEQLQMLPHSAFMQVLVVISCVVEACMMYSSQLGGLMEDILRGVKASQQQLATHKRDMQAALQAMADVAQGRWIKLISARTNAHTRLKLYEFTQLISVCERLLALPEQHGVKASVSLRSAVQGQCKAFLENVHAKNMMQLQHLLEAEQWVTVEVPASFQDIVQKLLDRCSALAQGVMRPAPAPEAPGQGAADGRHSPFQSFTAGSSQTGELGATTAAPSGAPAPRAPTPVLQLLGKQFHIVNSSLIMLKLLQEYLSLHSVVPLFGAEIAQRTMELLKFFNTQACQLVLGAGAMKTAGLRSISAKHLALACQAVNMLATLLPSLRAAHVALAPVQRRPLLLTDFDRLLQDLTLHMDEIHTKLVDIMQDRLAVAAKQLTQEADSWGKAPPGAAGYAPSESIRALSKQLGTLRSVLSPLLQRDEVELIFGRVASLYSETLSSTLDALIPKGQAWEEQRKANAQFILQCFMELPLESARASAYLSRLATFYSKHYGVILDPQQQAVVRQQQTIAPVPPAPPPSTATAAVAAAGGPVPSQQAAAASTSEAQTPGPSTATSSGTPLPSALLDQSTVHLVASSPAMPAAAAPLGSSPSLGRASPGTAPAAPVAHVLPNQASSSTLPHQNGAAPALPTTLSSASARAVGTEAAAGAGGLMVGDTPDTAWEVDGAAEEMSAGSSRSASEPGGEGVQQQRATDTGALQDAGERTPKVLAGGASGQLAGISDGGVGYGPE